MAVRTDASPARFDARLRTSLAAVVIAGAVLVLLALAFASVGAGVSALVGAALAAGNLWLLARIVAELLPNDRAGAESQSRGGWALVAGIKMFGLVALAWLLMRHGIVSPMPMLVGFGALPIGIAIGSLVSDRNAPPENEDG
jgi:hypothetical protein